MKENLRDCYPIASTSAVQAVSALDSLPTKVGEQLTLIYGGKKIAVSNISEAALTVGLSAKKLFDYLLLLVTKYNGDRGDWKNSDIRFTLSDYLVVMGLKDTRQNRHKYYDVIREDIQRLGYIHLAQGESTEWFGLVVSVDIRDRDGKVTKKEIISGDGCFEVHIQPGLLKHLKELSIILPYFTDLFKLSAQNVNAYAIGKKMVSHYGLRANEDKVARNKLGVETLLNCCPSLNSARDKDNRRTFEKALNLLASDIDVDLPLINWHYIYKDTKYTVEELRELKLSYSIWKKLMIQFEILNYPSTFANSKNLDSAYRLLIDGGKINGQETEE